MTTVTIIGAGNMGASLLGGLIADQYSPENLWITDPNKDKLAQLKNKFNINIDTRPQAAIKNAGAIILAVKPQIILSVAKEISVDLQARKPLIISVAAGMRIEELQNNLGEQIPIVRCMPNTPALINCGASALFANSYVSKTQHDLAESILRAVGITVWLEKESQMDAVTALSGCGPAYFFLVMDVLQSAAEKLGLPAEMTRLLTLQTALGAARMAFDSEFSTAELRRHVTSPGGATERALQVLEEGHIKQLFLQALTAAKNRAEELGSAKENS